MDSASKAARFVYITASSADEAAQIGRSLVEARLAACVNIIEGMRSIYHWQGKICEDSEVVLIAKTTSERVAELIAAVEKSHSYDCPCVVVLNVEAGSAGYLNWIGANVE